MNRPVKKIISTALISMLVFGVTGCGESQSQNQDVNQNQSQTQEQTQEQSQEEVSKEFSPKYPSDTEYKLSVVGTYSNFESLESAFEIFYRHYPDCEIE